jgi:hypothetical protein
MPRPPHSAPWLMSASLSSQKRSAKGGSKVSMMVGRRQPDKCKQEWRICTCDKMSYNLTRSSGFATFSIFSSFCPSDLFCCLSNLPLASCTSSKFLSRVFSKRMDETARSKLANWLLTSSASPAVTCLGRIPIADRRCEKGFNHNSRHNFLFSNPTVSSLIWRFASW